MSQRDTIPTLRELRRDIVAASSRSRLAPSWWRRCSERRAYHD
jgi:hypothetical protein